MELFRFIEGSLVTELLIMISPFQSPLYSLAITIFSLKGVVLALLHALTMEHVILERSHVATGVRLESSLVAVGTVVAELSEEE